MSRPSDVPLWMPLVVALPEVLVALWVLHGAVGRGMRARGMAWRMRDTALVSPLLLAGLLAFFGAANHGMLCWAAARDAAALGPAAAVAAGGLVVAWFGARAVGKLY